MSRNGYTEIASEESRPLNGSFHGVKYPGRGKILAAVVCVPVIVAAAVFLSRRATVAPTAAQEALETQPSEVPYRPICEYYRGTATLIQTSMQEPSEQWSPQACVDKSAFFGGTKSVLINAFSKPDAILQTNFSQLAHPDRQVPILGFGGAFTEASALNYERLSQAGKEAVMQLLFGKDGLGYALGRIHMNSCDFSVKSYSFDDTDGDFELKDFDIGVHHDVETGMVSMALTAVSYLKAGWGDTEDADFRLFASPWSPPSWMKQPTWEDSENATHAAKMTYSTEPSCLREGTGPDSKYAAAWALFFSKFLTAYSDLGLPFWAITVQNEPEFAAPWEACAYSKETQAAFLAYHLGPQLRKDHPEVKILTFDHNKDHVNNWTTYLLNPTNNASAYVDGTAYHWYAGGMDRLLDGALGSTNMHRLQDDLEDYGVKERHIVLGSESCHCPTTGYAGGDLEIAWARAERYGHTILADLAAGSNGWVEWNLVLDSIGGPNHLGNLCETGILAVPHRAKDATADIPPLPGFEFHTPMGDTIIGDGRTREELNALGIPAKYLDVGVAVQPLYFYMGHISRHVRPGSVAVMGLVHSSHGPGKTFQPEGSVVLGGGINDLARDGMEITIWPCEGSTRQQFKWNVDRQQHIQVLGHDWLGVPTKSCLQRSVDKDVLGLRLGSCKKGAGEFDILPIVGDKLGRYQIFLKNPDMDHTTTNCLVIRRLKNGGGAYGERGGAQLTLGSCADDSSRWFLDEATGEASSVFFDEEQLDNRVCMTTGWPFLQMGAFLTPNGSAPKTVVVLNEARDAANFALKDEFGVVATGRIPPRSIQTILLD